MAINSCGAAGGAAAGAVAGTAVFPGVGTVIGGVLGGVAGGLGGGGMDKVNTMSGEQQTVSAKLAQLLLGALHADGSRGDGLISQNATPYGGQIVPGMDPGYAAIRQLLSGYDPMSFLFGGGGGVNGQG